MTASAQTTADGPRTPVQIRLATKDDAIPLSKLGAHVFSVTFGHSVAPHELQAFLDKDYSVAAVTADIENAAKDVIVATDPDSDGEILGFGVLTRGSSEPCVDALEAKVELQRLYVHPKAHGKGLGGALARRLEQMAREQGFRHVWLGVWEENYAAQKAYEKWGYERVGHHDFVIGTVVQTDYILVKSF